MRAVVTRVKNASVTIDGKVHGAIGQGFLVLLGVHLFADCKSRRPGFSAAARPETAIPLYEQVIQSCRDRGFIVATGEFGADMQVASVNDGPVTILLDTNEL